MKWLGSFKNLLVKGYTPSSTQDRGKAALLVKVRRKPLKVYGHWSEEGRGAGGLWLSHMCGAPSRQWGQCNSAASGCSPTTQIEKKWGQGGNQLSGVPQILQRLASGERQRQKASMGCHRRSPRVKSAAHPNGNGNKANPYSNTRITVEMVSLREWNSER